MNGSNLSEDGFRHMLSSQVDNLVPADYRPVPVEQAARSGLRRRRAKMVTLVGAICAVIVVTPALSIQLQHRDTGHATVDSCPVNPAPGSEVHPFDTDGPQVSSLGSVFFAGAPGEGPLCANLDPDRYVLLPRPRPLAYMGITPDGIVWGAVRPEVDRVRFYQNGQLVVELMVDSTEDYGMLLRPFSSGWKSFTSFHSLAMSGAARISIEAIDQNGRQIDQETLTITGPAQSSR